MTIPNATNGPILHAAKLTWDHFVRVSTWDVRDHIVRDVPSVGGQTAHLQRRYITAMCTAPSCHSITARAQVSWTLEPFGGTIKSGRMDRWLDSFKAREASFRFLEESSICVAGTPSCLCSMILFRIWSGAM